MAWEAIAAIAEFIGAAGVIVSLLYLAYEVRRNTRILRADSNKDSARSRSDFNQWLSQHPSRDVLLRSFNPDESLESFSESDRQVLTLMFRSFAQLTESEYFQFRAGILESAVWEARRKTFRILIDFPVTKAVWENETKMPVYTKEFLASIESTEHEALSRETIWGLSAGDT